MATTNLNIKKTDIFYTPINGEIYELHIENMFVDIYELSTRNLYISDEDMDEYCTKDGNPFKLRNSKMVLFEKHGDWRYSNIGINQIDILLSNGEKRTWKWSNIRLRNANCFDPTKIYRTVDDCKNNVNHVFEGVFNTPNIMWLTTPYEVSLEDITPKNMYWKLSGLNIYGNPAWRLKTIKWDNTKLAPCEMSVHSNPAQMGRDIRTNEPFYSLLDEKLIIDDDYVNNGYLTEEECFEHNRIVIHKFA